MNSAASLAADNEKKRIAMRKFTDFLESDFGQGTYGERVRRMLARSQTRLVVSVSELRRHDRALCDELFSEPTRLMLAFDEALAQFVAAVRADDGAKETTAGGGSGSSFHVALEGAFGAHQCGPRELTASLLRQLVCVEGIVTKCSLIRPKLVESVHYCAKTKLTMTRAYRDATDGGMPTSSIYPTKDAENNPLTTEYGLCTYKDHQVVTIQEMPERSPAGQLPRSIDVVLENDLVDSCKPGDRVQVIGAYKALPAKQGAVTKGVFRTLLVANNVKQIATEVVGPVITPADIANIRTVAQDPNVFQLLAQSIAPSIYGHEYIKRAILLQLLGGCEKNLENGTHIRGDINLLMVGDPSTAKSQLLRYVLNIAPLAVSTSGRGSSGVGLTAAVTSDSETGERRLEAGAMVLADRGVVAIDEFDKMSVDDRVAIHEVMEQQTVTIAKAGIHCSLNARCSVIAAANPVYGQYNRTKRPTENIGLPDSLLSRFDLLFIVLDNLTPEHDRRIGDHVLRMHRYRRPGETDGVPLTEEDFDLNAASALAARDDDAAGGNVFQKFNRLLHGHERGRDLFSLSFLRKYIMYVKHRVRPMLTDETSEFLTSAYANLRTKEDSKTLPITARTFETMIRLSEAHAKCRLSPLVTVEDARAAIDVMNYALYHEATPATTARATEATAAVAAAVGADDSDATTAAAALAEAYQANGAGTKRPIDDGNDEDLDDIPEVDYGGGGGGGGGVVDDPDADVDDKLLLKRRTIGDDDERMRVDGESQLQFSVSESQPQQQAGDDEVYVSEERGQAFKQLVQAHFDRAQVDSATTKVLLDAVNEARRAAGQLLFTVAEARLVLTQMDGEGLLMYRDDVAYAT